MNCILCDKKDVSARQTDDPDVIEVYCSRCGSYKTTDTTIKADPAPEIHPRRYLISGITRNRTGSSAPPLLVTKVLWDTEAFREQVETIVPTTIKQKADTILYYLSNQSSHPGAFITMTHSEDYPLGYCENAAEFAFYLDFLEKAGMLLRKKTSSPHQVSTVALTVDAWNDVQGKGRHAALNQAFIAMSFHEDMDDAFLKGIKPLEATTGFTMVRVDREQFNGKICDRILAEIRKSRFLVADVTGHRQGVYFEAGFAMGLQIPVIWTCRHDQIEKAHFDTRQYNHIVWETPAELAEKLEARVLATI